MSDRAMRGADSGSLTLELVILSPIVFLFVMGVVLFGRVSGVRQQVIEEARAGAQLAAIAPDRANAAQGAEEGVADGVGGKPDRCQQKSINTDLNHFYPGGYVTVALRCTVNLADVAIPGIPGMTVIQVTATAPIDPYQSIP